MASSTANLPNRTTANHWQTCKQVGVPCGRCGKTDTCTVSPDGMRFKCWRNGGKVHLTGKPGKRIQKPEDYGKHSKPQPKLSTFLSAADAIAGYRMGMPAKMWTYRDAQGKDVLVVARWDKRDGGKVILPAGFIGTGWTKADPPEPLPLYRLPELLTADPAEAVFVCEGEKATDAAVGIGLMATTSSHGSSSAARTNWGPLAGRNVVILPDNDETGAHYRDDVTAILAGLNPPAIVRVVNLPGLPEHGDMVEYLDLLDSKEPDELRAGIMELVASAGTAVVERPGPTIICMANVVSEPIPWLWKGRIPSGRLSLLVGDPGMGKSYATCDFASRVSTGTPWPDGAPCECGDVLFIAAEDDPADTIRPRLDAHHADVTRVHLLEGVRRRDDSGRMEDAAFTLADIPALEAALKGHPDTKLVIIDPVGSVLGGKTDAHRDNEVRAVLAPVARLAAKYGPAMLLVMHRKKAKGGTADSMALGSTGFVGIARVVWHLCRDKDNRERRLFLPGKNNLAKDCGGLAFAIEGDPVGVVHWEKDPVFMSADDAVAEEAGQKRGPSADALEDAKTLLRDELRDGPKRCGYDRKKPDTAEPGTIWATALEAAISWRTLRRAKDILRVSARKQQFTGHWQWELPPEKQGVQPPSDKGSMDTMDPLDTFDDSPGKTP